MNERKPGQVAEQRPLIGTPHHGLPAHQRPGRCWVCGTLKLLWAAWMRCDDCSAKAVAANGTST